MSESTVQLQVANAQRAHAKTRATKEILFGKKPRRDEFEANLSDDPTDESGIVNFLFVAIKPDVYDELLAKHPPTEEQVAKAEAQGGRTEWNIDTFPPALLSAVCRDPKMSEDDWSGLFHHEGWTRGEIGSLFWRANNLCNAGLDAGPLGRVSAAIRSSQQN